MRFFADRAVGHRAALEALHNFFDRFNLFDGNRVFRPSEFEQAAERAQVLRLVVHQFGVFLEDLEAARATGELELVDGLRVEQVILAVRAPLVLAAGIERGAVHLPLRKGVAMPLQHLFGQHVHTDALDAGWRPGEIPVNDGLIQPDSLEDLRAAVALNGGDAHLGHRLHNAFHGGLDVFLDRGLVIEVRQHALADHVAESFEGEIGIDGAATVANEQ